MGRVNRLWKEGEYKKRQRRVAGLGNGFSDRCPNPNEPSQGSNGILYITQGIPCKSTSMTSGVGVCRPEAVQ